MIFVSGGNNIRCSPYVLYGTKKLSEHAVAALEGRKACLLGHHGMIAVGSSLKQSLWRAIEVETLARQYHGCLQLGEEPDLLSEKQVEEVLRKTGEYGL
jgi:L-fuculose-phosphate aldolase